MLETYIVLAALGVWIHIHVLFGSDLRFVYFIQTILKSMGYTTGIVLLLVSYEW